MFLHKLRQLVWKNVLIRRRSKTRVVAEILLPLALFIVFALIRQNVSSFRINECFLDEKALPSAGSARFFQSFFCTSFNFCYNSPQQSTTYHDEDLQYIQIFLSELHGNLSKIRNRSLRSAASYEKSGYGNQLLGDILDPLFMSSSFAANQHQWGSFDEDLLVLESVFAPFGKLANSTIGKMATRLANGTNKSGRAVLEDISLLVCGRNISFPLDPPLAVPSVPGYSINPRGAVRSTDDNEKTVKGGDKLPDKCHQLFSFLSNSTNNGFLYKTMYPFVRGKIVYAPNTPAFNAVIQRVNETFQDLRQVQKVATKWLNDLSPNITASLNRMDHFMANASELVNDCPKMLPRCQTANDSLKQIAGNVTRVRDAVNGLDYLANNVNNFIDCYDFDKFVGLPDETEAVNYGIKLLSQNQLWAVIVFEETTSNATSSDIPPYITYKIRMDRFLVDDTRRIKDLVQNPWPRHDTKSGHNSYLSSGFIYLQDKIDRAIIELHSNRHDLPQMYAEQLPNPCSVIDEFIVGIGHNMPLYLILSFVFTCAMIVRSIVHEKERRLKETMRMMGLGNGVHWLAWFIDSMFTLLPVCIILPFILSYGRIYPETDPSVYFVLLLSFCVANIGFSFLVSTFFSRANVAAACAAFIYFITFQPFFLTMMQSRPSLTVQLLLSLLSNVAFGIGNAHIAKLEVDGRGVQWYNIGASSTYGDPLSISTCIVMLLVDAIVYMLIAFYIEQVFPGTYGVPKPWYFLFQRSFWFSKNDRGRFERSSEEQQTMTSNSDLIEPEPKNSPIGVDVRNLGKTFSNGKQAVKNLNLIFYQNQITSFLGHNGAGKTTTISILTGLYPPTSGTAIIDGFDIRYQTDEIRQQLGLCPQFNVLFDELTVEEHLIFYANLKTGKGGSSKEEIDQMIEDLGLSHKRNELSLHLSGGMKRKLSIGTAFIGHSKTVILDEPTAGVDPYSRQSIWRILLKYKAGRTIILTTHFMDEADLLGDRIAIISQGQLKCCGSSLFLKRKLGNGYYLTLVRKEGSASSQVITDILNRHIPNHHIVQDAGTDLVICLPECDAQGSEQRHKFPPLLEELESNMDEAFLDSYGVSDTTLENVFLKVANEEDPSGSDSTSCQLSSSDDVNVPPGSDDCSNSANEKLTGMDLFFQHITALLLIKNFCNSKRNLKGFVCEVILPIILLFVIELMIFMLKTPSPPLVLTPWLYGQSTVSFFANRNPAGRVTNEFVRNLVNGTGMGVRCMSTDPLHFGRMCSDSVLGLLNPEVNPRKYEDFRCPCEAGVAVCPSNISGTGLWKYRSVSSDEFYDLSENDVRFWAIRTHAELKHIRIGGFEFGVHKGKKNRTSHKTLDSNVKIWYQNKLWASSASFLNAVNNVILRSSLPRSKDPYRYGITTINHPLDFSQHSSLTPDQVGLSMILAVVMVFAMSFVPASFVVFLVEETMSKARHIQFVSGLKPITFWISTYMWHLIMYSITSMSIVVVLICFGQWEYVGSDSIAGMILLLILFGCSAIPLMYPASLFFSVPSTAFIFTATGSLLVGTVSTIASFIFQALDNQVLKQLESAIDQIFIIFPHFCLGRGIIVMAQEYYIRQYNNIFGKEYEIDIFAWNYLGRYFFSLMMQTVVFFSFNLFLHYFPFFLKSRKPCSKKAAITSPLENEDQDVARERRRVEGECRSNDELRLLRLSKKYGGKERPAADQLSFGVSRGECFGLLGVNGAGKTTTFKMLTGEEPVTDGNAFLSGFSILSQLEEARQHLGYCPQEDALLSRLTCEEHLRFFAKLRGIPKHQLNKVVQTSLASLDLVPYAKRCADTLSGGNKRKLAAAIALIGDPAVVLLDEPSTGMDPKARRFLWKTIIDVMNDSRSLLVTSHSMEECQVLCTRLAVMVDGTLRCLGSPQHLKNRFGDGYMINVRCDGEAQDEVIWKVQVSIPEAQLREQRPRQLIWHVKLNSLSVSILFSRMEAIRIACTSVMDYSIAQTTLNDVFVRFAQLQCQVLEDKRYL